MTSWILLALVASESPEIRPEIDALARQADAFIGDLDEDKAVALISARVAKGDLASAELALLEFERGVALMGLNKVADAETAFSTARGCNGLLEAPASLSPKIRKVFGAAVPRDCPVGARQAPDPTEAIAAAAPVKHDEPRPPAPTPAPVATPPPADEGGGISPLAMVGGGVAVVGGAVLLLAVIAAVVSTGAVVGSYPLQAAAKNAELAKDARQKSTMAFALRVSGAAALAVAALVALAGVAALGTGAAAAVKGFTQ